MFRAFGKISAWGVCVNLISEGMIFQKEGATTEKDLLLVPTRSISLIGHNISGLLTK